MDDRRSRLNMLGFAVIAIIGTVSLIVGLIVGVVKEPDEQRLSSTLITAGCVLLAVTTLIVVLASARDARRWLADIFPNAKRRDDLAAAAAALGLRSTDPGYASLDIAFPFGTTVTRSGATFAGTWRGLHVRVFDCWRQRSYLSRALYLSRGGAEQWTCAILPIESRDAEVKISRQSLTTRIVDLVGMPGTTFHDPEFDRAFRVETASKNDARLLDERARSLLMKDAPEGRLAIEIAGGGMLYCRSRVSFKERGALLEAAKRLRDALMT